ncbi:hypothetical protein IG631_19966 [Alternaria alternata]|nr:hypothetical protein IG631_19966 [Alternaria alternata]
MLDSTRTDGTGQATTIQCLELSMRRESKGGLRSAVHARDRRGGWLSGSVNRGPARKPCTRDSSRAPEGIYQVAQCATVGPSAQSLCVTHHRVCARRASGPDFLTPSQLVNTVARSNGLWRTLYLHMLSSQASHTVRLGQ